MRGRLRNLLANALSVALRRDWPDMVRLDPKRDAFNGLIGYRLGVRGLRTLFLTITPHESEDMFRCNLAWSIASGYPIEPFSDLHATAEQHWSHGSAELQLADLAPGQAPYQFELDPSAVTAREKQAAIAARLAAGEHVSEEEWLDTLGTKCPLETAAGKALEAAALIAGVLRTSILGSQA
jgi:hypothetical protein